MTAPDRTAIRNKLKDLLVGRGSWEAVYTAQPKVLGGISPVAEIYNGPLDALPGESYGDLESGGDVYGWLVHLHVENLVRRDSTGSDAEDAEATMDDLLEALHTVVQGNRSTTLWSDLWVMLPTEPVYHEIDGLQYRGELVTVVALVLK